MQGDLDPDSPVPLYKQLAARLRERIAADELTRLPSWRTLSQEYGVSRPTVEDAVQILKDAGEVFVVDGKGTYVGRPPEAPAELSRAPPPGVQPPQAQDVSGCVLCDPEPVRAIPIASRPMDGEDPEEQPRIHLRRSEHRYVQVADDIEQRIRAGEFAYDSALPRREDLAHEYGVGEMTVRRALGELRDRGLVRPMPSVGTIVIWPGHSEGT